MLKRILPLYAAVLAIGACSDAALLLPPDDEGPLASPPSFAIVDAASGGSVPGFWFLQPLVATQPVTQGTFDPTLRPSMQVCELTGNPSSYANPNWASVTCTSTVVKYFPPGSASVGLDSYHFGWNTQKVGEMDPSKYYRIRISLEGRDLGYLDINPQQPSGESPGADYPDLYAFRVGENLPVKIFLTRAALCETGESYVIQCTASAVIDQTGGVLSLEPEQPGYPKLSVVLPAGALPGSNQTVRVTMERISPELFLQDTGEPCIPMFDAPQFSDCLRVTTDPVLEAPLEALARIEMCIDPYALGLPLGQAERLQIIRYGNSGVIQGLPTVEATTCGALPAPAPDVLGLLPVPKTDGLLRKAVVGVNTLARALGPEPLAAIGEIRLAGATSNFSRFRWALPGEMVKTAGDGLVLQASDSKLVTATVRVVDAAGVLVESATVHFSNGDDVISGADGLASTSWNLEGTAGPQTLTATALGLLDATVPGNETLINFSPKTVTFSATVVGAPAAVTTTGTLPANGAIVASAWPGIGATVTDAFDVVATDANVVWTQQSPGCTGTEATCGTVVSNGNGTITWTLGQIPGPNTLIGTVAGTNPAVTTQVTVTTVAAPAHHVIVSPVGNPVVGQTYTMTGTVQDQYNNTRASDQLAWAVAAGGGGVTGSAWTLGTAAGSTNTITASVVGASPAVSASHSVTPVADVPDKVVKVSGDAQAGPINMALAQPLVVQVTDRFDNVTPSQGVSWSATGGSSVTASAPYLWTLGPTANATYTATASVMGGSQAATFTATSVCFVTVNGAMAAGEWACAESRSFTANISGGSTPAEVYWQNNGTNVYVAVRVRQSVLVKPASVRFDFDNDGLGVHNTGDDAIGYDAGAATFFDHYLTAKCASNGQAGCGSPDPTRQDGAGAIGNDGTWTVYELSHPLQGTAGEDFIRSAGQNLGFFLTLRIGNGAQGNTQWPGFRMFQGITIR
ncbi:MAG: hypothetical protein Q8N53_05595 [Longimicrobiales bacterium]|nr:hypothetical protein [Longimicrobiales bacterium]